MSYQVARLGAPDWGCQRLASDHHSAVPTRLPRPASHTERPACLVVWMPTFLVMVTTLVHVEDVDVATSRNLDRKGLAPWRWSLGPSAHPSTTVAGSSTGLLPREGQSPLSARLPQWLQAIRRLGLTKRSGRLGAARLALVQERDLQPRSPGHGLPALGPSSRLAEAALPVRRPVGMRPLGSWPTGYRSVGVIFAVGTCRKRRPNLGDLSFLASTRNHGQCRHRVEIEAWQPCPQPKSLPRVARRARPHHKASSSARPSRSAMAGNGGRRGCDVGSNVARRRKKRITLRTECSHHLDGWVPWKGTGRPAGPHRFRTCRAGAPRLGTVGLDAFVCTNVMGPCVGFRVLPSVWLLGSPRLAAPGPLATMAGPIDVGQGHPSSASPDMGADPWPRAADRQRFCTDVAPSAANCPVPAGPCE